MKIFKRIATGVVIAVALLISLGCAGERRNVAHKQLIATAEPSDFAPLPTATVTAHVSNCSDTDADGYPIIECFVDFIPVGKDGKYDLRPQRYPNVRVNVRGNPDADGNLTVELSPGSYNVWMWSSHIMQGKTLMGIGVGEGAKLSLELNAQ